MDNHAGKLGSYIFSLETCIQKWKGDKQKKKYTLGSVNVKTSPNSQKLEISLRIKSFHSQTRQEELDGKSNKCIPDTMAI